jgi:hypothetical protein
VVAGDRPPCESPAAQASIIAAVAAQHFIVRTMDLQCALPASAASEIEENEENHAVPHIPHSGSMRINPGTQ